MRTVQILPVRELTEQQQTLWADLQASNPAVDSPFYTPDFARLVASVRSDAAVAVMGEDGETVGFFPFLRSPGYRARPIAGRLTEFHGPVTGKDFAWDPATWLKMGGLRSWYFDHLPASHSGCARHAWGSIAAPYADLRRGFEAYEIALRCGGGTIAQLRQKERKLSREVGPVRFGMHTKDDSAFQALLTWKTEQYEQCSRLGIFNYSWTVQLLEAIRRYSSQRFAGVLSALYAGDQLAAVHLGIRTSRVLHIWFPACSLAFEPYSPGLILLLYVIEQSARSGITRIDFGPGEEGYKQQFKSADTPLLVGGIDSTIGRAGLHRGWYALNEWIRRSRYRGYLEIPINATRRYRQNAAFRQ